jgi:hypothetical protein
MGEKHFEEFEPERLVKSTERVKDLGEVYTPSNIVDDMLDLLPESIWAVHPAPTFLEPSVGNGNFVSAILSRKLTLVDDCFRSGSLPAGASIEAAEFHALEALSSIYGVDISEDNIIGGTPGHEVACRPRLLKIMTRWHEALFDGASETYQSFAKAAKWIVEHNMIIGNMLARDADGLPTGRDELVLMEYQWNAMDQSVNISKTSLGAVIGEAEESQSDVLSLFGPEPAVKIWSGSVFEMSKAKKHATLHLTGKRISNSKGGSK